MTTSADQLVAQLTQAMTQMAAVSQSSDTMAHQMSQGLSTLAQRFTVYDEQRSQDLQAIHATMNAVHQQGQRQAQLRTNRLFETKGFMKPPHFSGAKDDWKDWKMKMLMWLDTEKLWAKKLLSAVEGEDGAVSGVRLPPAVEDDIEATDGQYQAFDKELYVILLGLCAANSVPMEYIRMSEEQSGLEVWRRMSKHYEPKSIQATMALFPSLIHPKGATLYDCPLAIEHWERRIREFEKRSAETGSPTFQFTEEMKIWILLSHLVPKVLKDHIEFNLTRFDTYDKVKSEIERYVAQKRSTEELRGSGAAPMEIGALQGSSSNSGCWNCGSVSHYARDCKEKPKSKGKGKKGRGRTRSGSNTSRKSSSSKGKRKGRGKSRSGSKGRGRGPPRKGKSKGRSKGKGKRRKGKSKGKGRVHSFQEDEPNDERQPQSEPDEDYDYDYEYEDADWSDWEPDG